MTSEAVQQYIRVVIYWLAGFAVHYGWITSSNKTAIAGAAITVANLIWTIYGTRFMAKVTELAKYNVVQNVILTTKEMADAVPSDKVIAAPPK
jgi:hypothetical protein